MIERLGRTQDYLLTDGVFLCGLPEGYHEFVRDVLACAVDAMYVTRQRAESVGTAVDRVEAVLAYIDRRRVAMG